MRCRGRMKEHWRTGGAGEDWSEEKWRKGVVRKQQEKGEGGSG
jgi:hypothetical protein